MLGLNCYVYELIFAKTKLIDAKTSSENRFRPKPMPRAGTENVKARSPNKVWADAGTHIVGCSTLCVDAGSRFYRPIMADKINEGCVCQKKPGHFVKQLHQYLHYMNDRYKC